MTRRFDSEVDEPRFKAVFFEGSKCIILVHHGRSVYPISLKDRGRLQELSVFESFYEV